MSTDHKILCYGSEIAIILGVDANNAFVSCTITSSSRAAYAAVSDLGQTMRPAEQVRLARFRPTPPADSLRIPIAYTVPRGLAPQVCALIQMGYKAPGELLGAVSGFAQDEGQNPLIKKVVQTGPEQDRGALVVYLGEDEVVHATVIHSTTQGMAFMHPRKDLFGSYAIARQLKAQLSALPMESTVPPYVFHDHLAAHLFAGVLIDRMQKRRALANAV